MIKNVIKAFGQVGTDNINTMLTQQIRLIDEMSYINQIYKKKGWKPDTEYKKKNVPTAISIIYMIFFITSPLLIDGININNIKKRDLRRNVSVVLQDVFLFSGTIEKNITLNDSIPEDIVNKAIETSYAKEFIATLPNGIYEPVMERGSTLSAGERQLLAFARTLAFNPSILILDEATAIDTLCF